MYTTIFKKSIAVLTAFFITGLSLVSSCTKEKKDVPAKDKPSQYPSGVLDKWITLQLRLMRNATGIPNHGFSRHFAYTGIAALESLEPTLHGQNKWSAKWNGLAGLPVADHKKSYYYPANVNAAMASINRLMFPNAAAADKQAIDSLELALTQEFLLTQDAVLLNGSSVFGRSVAAAVFSWSETDGSKQANDPYTVPVGPGLWKPTAPAFANPATPFWGNNRPVIKGSITNTQPAAPVAYSTNAGSSFHQMVKQVYDISQVLTDDQKAMAVYWRDIPGVSSPGHWLSIIQQVLKQGDATLEQAALAYALTGAAVNDALITCFQTKYQVNLVRPITYIREVMGQNNWSPFLGTPAHPEYPSAHSSLSLAAGSVLENLFGQNKTFTDHTYDYMGFPARTYSSYLAIGIEAGQSRLYGGIHYQPSIDAGVWQGKKVAENIFSK